MFRPTISRAPARSVISFAKRAGHHVVGVFKETASGTRNDRAERQKVMDLARAREIDAILVTELSRWGRSTQDLVQTLDDLHSWKVSVLAQTGLSFDLSTASGKLMRTIMAGLAEFERDLIRDRVKSGLAAARARGVALGRKIGFPPVRQESQARARHASRGPVLPADRPQPRLVEEYRYGDRQACGRLMVRGTPGVRLGEPGRGIESHFQTQLVPCRH